LGAPGSERQGSKPKGPRRGSGSVAKRREPGATPRLTAPCLAGQQLAFDGETLNEAITEVSRQTGWRFELEDPALGEIRVGGYVHADPEAFIELMSSSLQLGATRDGNRRIMPRR
jgi:ferric-dicitrate binding protein FerR (iron transport regulator)